MPKRFTVLRPFVARILASDDVATYMLDWTHVAEGGPLAHHYFFAKGERLELSDEGMMRHERTNRVVNQIIMPRASRIESLLSRQLIAPAE